MPAVVEAPVEFVEALAGMTFPPKADLRLQSLMDRNTEGELTADERDELESLVELSETMSLFRGKAQRQLTQSSEQTSWPCQPGSAKDRTFWMAKDFDAPLIGSES